MALNADMIGLPRDRQISRLMGRPISPRMRMQRPGAPCRRGGSVGSGHAVVLGWASARRWAEDSRAENVLRYTGAGQQSVPARHGRGMGTRLRSCDGAYALPQCRMRYVPVVSSLRCVL